MLPAVNQKNQPTTAVANPDALARSGFGKVLGSIQGLQQRLDDFTLDDVVGAESNLKTQMQRILRLRDRLTNIRELKNVVSEAQQLSHDTPEEGFALVGPDSLEKHPQLHAIVKASKLIRLHRLMKAARAGADAVSFDADAGVLHLDSAGRETRREAGRQEITRAVEISASVAAPTIAPSLVAIGAPDSGQAIVIEAPASIETPAVALVEAPEPTVANLPLPIDAQATADFAAMASRENRSRTQTQLASQTQLAKTENKLDQSKPLDAAAHSAIDQRLLDDLIENYGDFTVTPNLPARVETQIPATIKAVEPKDLAALEFDKPVADSRSAPNLKKAGDLDRQLKKIIKDYGEYDLYSKQSPLNLKTGGIALFVVLGLLLAGLYLFKAPTTVASAPTNAVTQASEPAPAKTVTKQKQ